MGQSQGRAGAWSEGTAQGWGRRGLGTEELWDWGSPSPVPGTSSINPVGPYMLGYLGHPTMALEGPRCHMGLSALMGIIVPTAWPGTPRTLEMDTWILGATWDP